MPVLNGSPGLVRSVAGKRGNVLLVEADVGGLVADLAGKSPLGHTHVAANVTDFNTAADARITAARGAANGIAPLDAGSKVPAANLPSYVDDVLEFANLAAFPNPGAAGVIYVALDTNRVYRWSGTVYIEVSPAPVTSVNGQTGTVALRLDQLNAPQSQVDLNNQQIQNLAYPDEGSDAASAVYVADYFSGAISAYDRPSQGGVNAVQRADGGGGFLGNDAELQFDGTNLAFGGVAGSGALAWVSPNGLTISRPGDGGSYGMGGAGNAYQLAGSNLGVVAGNGWTNTDGSAPPTPGGNLLLQAGSGGNDDGRFGTGAENATGGNVTILAGAGGSSFDTPGGTGGDVDIWAGSAGGISGGTGGKVTLHCDSGTLRLAVGTGLTLSAGQQYNGVGTGLTALNASNMTLGALADARLSGNVPLKNTANSFTQANTFSGAVVRTATGNTYTSNGALSGPVLAFTGTPVTGGTATTCKPQILVEPTAATSTGWQTSGTMLGLNSLSGFGGYYLDVQKNGSRLCYIDNNGTFNSSSGSYFAGNINANNNFLLGTSVAVTGSWPRLDIANGYGRTNINNGSANSSTSGSFYLLQVTGTYNQASGSAANTDLLINATRTAVGSGAQWGIEYQVGSSQKFAVDTAGGVVVGSGTLLKKVLSATAALDFASTNAQLSADLTMTVTGAAVGDVVLLGVPNGATLANCDFSAWVSATNTVTVRLNNYSSSAKDPPSGTFRATVLQF